MKAKGKMLQAEGSGKTLGGIPGLGPKARMTGEGEAGTGLQGLGGHRKERIYSKQVFSWGRISD